MNRPRDWSWTVALCLSLMTNGLIVWALLEGKIREDQRRIVQWPDWEKLLRMPTITLEDEKKEQRTSAVKAAEEEKLPQLAMMERKKVAAPLPMIKSVFGEMDGHGEAEMAWAGKEEMKARHVAPEVQAFLSRDPQGEGRVGEKPTMAVGKAGNGGGRSGEMQQQAAAARQEVAKGQGGKQEHDVKGEEVLVKPVAGVAFGVPEKEQEFVAPKTKRNVAEGISAIAMENAAKAKAMVGKVGGKDVEDVKEQEAKKAAQARPAEKSAGSAVAVAGEKEKPVEVATAARRQVVQSGGKPGKAGAESADPAPMSDSELDAFGKVANITFENGRVEAQFGRKIKTVRPKLLLSARYDIFEQENPRVLLTAKVDATGHVTKVDIYQSSGTPDLDQPCLVALYDWWFEPPRDKEGKPMPDVVVVAITFRT